MGSALNRGRTAGVTVFRSSRRPLEWASASEDVGARGPGALVEQAQQGPVGPVELGVEQAGHQVVAGDLLDDGPTGQRWGALGGAIAQEGVEAAILVGAPNDR